MLIPVDSTVTFLVVIASFDANSDFARRAASTLKSQRSGRTFTRPLVCLVVSTRNVERYKSFFDNNDEFANIVVLPLRSALWLGACAQRLINLIAICRQSTISLCAETFFQYLERRESISFRHGWEIEIRCSQLANRHSRC